MVDRIAISLTLVSALGCGLMAGVFFAFSAFVMKALARLPAAQGIAAMQSINVAAVTPLFMTALFGTAAACLLLFVLALSDWQKPGAAYLLTGSLFYLGGAILVTIAFHVPRNEMLALIVPENAGSAAIWVSYVNSWTAWNHVRGAAALAAAALLTVALVRSAAFKINWQN